MVTTDASLVGWGAVLERKAVQGEWSESDKTLPINILEIWAVRLALRAWSGIQHGYPIRIQSDNAMGVAYINHQGGTKSWVAQKEVDYIVVWAEVHVPCLSAVFILGVENWQTDFLSRQPLLAGELSLQPEVFLAICQKWGTHSLAGQTHW